MAELESFRCTSEVSVAAASGETFESLYPFTEGLGHGASWWCRGC